MYHRATPPAALAQPARKVVAVAARRDRDARLGVWWRSERSHRETVDLAPDPLVIHQLDQAGHLMPGVAGELGYLSGERARSRDPQSAHAFSDQSGYSSLRQARGSSGGGFGVRWSRNEWYGATNGSGA